MGQSGRLQGDVKMGAGSFAAAAFEDGRKGHKPKNVGSCSSKKATNKIFPKLPEKEQNQMTTEFQRVGVVPGL